MPYLIASAVGCSFDPAGEGATAPAAPDAGAAAPDAGKAPADPDATPEPSGGQVSSLRVTAAPELDADPEDWASVAFSTFKISEAMQYWSVHPSYGYDAVVRFASVHDSQRIYFYFSVTDDVVVNEPASIFSHDGVELYLDAAGDGAGPYDMDDHWIVISSRGVYSSLGPGQIPITGSVQETDVGYDIEIAIEKASMGATITTGAIGFNVGLTDNDGLGAGPGPNAYGLWYLPDGDRCTACCDPEDGPQAWCDTTMFGELTLLP